MKEGYWMVRTYEAGAVGEKTKYFVPGTRPTGKIRRKDRDAIRKAEQNEYSAQKALARILNANFTAGDLLMGLDYSEKGMQQVQKRAGELMEECRTLAEHIPPASLTLSHPPLGKGGLEAPAMTGDEWEQLWQNALYDAAEKELENGLRRVKNRLKAHGIELRAAYITSDTDGETGETVRVHHHLVVNKEAKEAFLAAWEEKGKGGVSWTPLWEDQQDRTAIAEYFIRQVRHRKDMKKFRTTRNMVRPQPKDRIALSEAELRIPAGGTLLFRQEHRPGRAQYIRYLLPEKKNAKGRETDIEHIPPTKIGDFGHPPLGKGGLVTE